MSSQSVKVWLMIDLTERRTVAAQLNVGITMLTNGLLIVVVSSVMHKNDFAARWHKGEPNAL